MDDNYDFEGAGEYHSSTPFETQPNGKTSYSVISSLPCQRKARKR
jgi:hypothetical protein